MLWRLNEPGSGARSHLWPTSSPTCKTLRSRARQQIDKGPVTQAHGADVDRVIEVCQGALATEIVCVLRYKQNYSAATGLNAEPVAAEFLQHAGEEQQHAALIAARIDQLGGTPDFTPDTLTARSHAEYTTATELSALITENLVAERIAIESYTEIIMRPTLCGRWVWWSRR